MNHLLAKTHIDLAQLAKTQPSELNAFLSTPPLVLTSRPIGARHGHASGPLWRAVTGIGRLPADLS
jgi:hypothetical protein